MNFEKADFWNQNLLRFCDNFFHWFRMKYLASLTNKKSINSKCFFFFVFKFNCLRCMISIRIPYKTKYILFIMMPLMRERFTCHGFLNKDPMVWLDGARTPAKVRLKVFKKATKNLAKSLPGWATLLNFQQKVHKMNLLQWKKIHPMHWIKCKFLSSLPPMCMGNCCGHRHLSE